MRGGADGVGASRPQLIPATILRKNFEFIAAIKPHEVPNRPEFYMIGSGITKASLNALTIGATCTHEDFRAPCFTAEEIAQAKTQLTDEQYAFDELTVEEQAAHTAEGGLAVQTVIPCFEYHGSYDGVCIDDNGPSWGLMSWDDVPPFNQNQDTWEAWCSARPECLGFTNHYHYDRAYIASASLTSLKCADPVGNKCGNNIGGAGCYVKFECGSYVPYDSSTAV